MGGKRFPREQEQFREFFKEQTLPVMHRVIQTLVNSALSGDVRSALAILQYHAPPPKDALIYAQTPDRVKKAPLEERSEEIAQLVMSGDLDLDSAERLSKLVDTHMRQQHTEKFMRFLRQIGEGKDPVALARQMARELQREVDESLH